MRYKNMLYGSDVSHTASNVSSKHTSTSRRHPALFILIGAVLLVAALWSYMAFTASTHQTLDQHVYAIGAQLKCPVCQGESVADSNSQRAQEIRAIIRQQILVGQSDQQIIQYFSDRYGNEIVWSPPWWGFSLLAWIVPVALLLGGLVFIVFTLRDWTSSTPRGVVPATAVAGDDTELAGIDEAELARYRMQLERELADEDALFEPSRRDQREEGE